MVIWRSLLGDDYNARKLRAAVLWPLVDSSLIFPIIRKESHHKPFKNIAQNGSVVSAAWRTRLQDSASGIAPQQKGHRRQESPVLSEYAGHPVLKDFL